MAITIKEIQVKTVVERGQPAMLQLDEMSVRKMRDQLYRQLKKDIEREIRRRRER